MQFHIKNMTCGGCARSVTKAIQSVDAQAKVTIDPNTRKVDVANREAGLLQRQPGGRDRPEAHIKRLDAGMGLGDEPRHRLEPEPLDGRFAGKHQRGGAVIDTG